ncbi:DUF5808 domain-containing protein [Actinomyces sp. B33]|uniref:DUF5808 domain-containing protein n=1 Tax=Actinomyces sp. B33 TaxID=2942131 RepID=UPI0023423DDE|nr:DUF5808 domain-containing protein [Actinomyces sp. B33]MDC4232793.1 DUF5808 domain-containing protein [Actinomyces sp. B33]
MNAVGRPRRALPIPASLDGLLSADARQDIFEPENPRLLVPRTVGVGWDLNFGALAVRLGLIRPDDSLPDLRDHIPERVSRALALAPVLGLCAVAGTVLAAHNHPELPSRWTPTLRPKTWKPARRVGLQHLGVAGLLAAWAEWADQTDGRVDPVASALTAGLHSSSVLLLLAAARAARKPTTDHPSVLAAVAMVAPVVVTTGLLVATVTSALDQIAEDLARARHDATDEAPVRTTPQENPDE